MPPDSSHFTQAQIVSCTYITTIKYKIIWRRFNVHVFFLPSSSSARPWMADFFLLLPSPPPPPPSCPPPWPPPAPPPCPAILSSGILLLKNSFWEKPRPTPLCPRHHCTTTLLPSSELTRIHVVLFIFVTHSVDLCKQMYYSKCSCVMKNGTPVKFAKINLSS